MNADLPTAARYEVNGAVATLTIDAFKMRNSLGAPGVREGLDAAIAEFEANPELRVMVLTGAGGVFSAGGNLNKLLDMREIDTIRARLETGGRTLERILKSTKLYIAAVEGPAFGAGMGLAMCCDLVVASDTARFCAAQIRVGAAPDGGLFWALPLRTGPAVARRILLTGEEISRDAALAAGMVDYAARDGAALDEAQAIAARLAAGPPLAQASVKAFFVERVGKAEDVLAWERENAAQSFMTDDFVEGATAFLEKRKAQFGGR